MAHINNIPSDESLIERSKQDDKDAFGELFERHNKRIYRYLYRYTGDYTLAKDLLVETFINAYKNIRKYKESGKFLSWMYKIATNCALQALRKLKKTKSREISFERPITEDGSITLSDVIGDEEKDPSVIVNDKELMDDIYSLIMSLDEKYREVIFLCEVEGNTIAETAKIINVNHNTAATRLRRAKQMIIDLMGKKIGQD